MTIPRGLVRPRIRVARRHFRSWLLQGLEHVGSRPAAAILAGFLLPAAGVLPSHAQAAPRMPVEDEHGAPRAPAATAGEGFTDVAAESGLVFHHHIADGALDTILESVGSGACVLDADGDGHYDVLLLQGAWMKGVSTGDAPPPGTGSRFFRNRGDGTFEDVTEHAGLTDTGFAVAAAAADTDNDGDTDLLVVGYGHSRFFRNRGDGTFEDRTASSGISLDGFPDAATFLDYDGDGDLDLFVARYVAFDPDYHLYYGPDAFPGPLAYEPEEDRLFRNRGDGTFEDVTRQAGIAGLSGRGMGVLAGDFDGDGDPDLFVANDATENFLLRNEGDGTLAEVGLELGVAYGQNGEATAAMAGDRADADGDGRLDLVVSDTSFGSLYHALGKGLHQDIGREAGLAALKGQYVSWGIQFLDFDRDGDPDLFIANGGLHQLEPWENLLLENRGDGHFVDGASRGGPGLRALAVDRGCYVWDFDDDGDPDVLLTRLNDVPALLRNDVAPGASWIGVDLVGTASGRDGFGARVAVTAGGRTQVAEHRCPTVYLGQGDPRLLFGLADAETAERIEVFWPSGAKQTLRDIAARRYVRIEEPPR